MGHPVVRVLMRGEDFSLSHVNVFTTFNSHANLGHGLGQHPPATPAGSRPNPHSLRPSRITAAALSLYGPPDANPELIADGCAIIGAVRTDPGRFSEPTIYATIGVLQHCDPGTHQGRSWFDSGFADEVDQKFRHHEQDGIGPTTCAYFAGLNTDNAQACKACPHFGKITSPIQLGRRARRPDPLPGASQPGEASADGGPSKQADATTEAQTAPGSTQGVVIENYVNHPDGLKLMTENKDGKIEYIQITRGPVEYVATVRAESSTSHSTVLNYTLPNGTPFHAVVPNEVLWGPRSRSECAKLDIKLREGDGAELLRAYIDLCEIEYYKMHPAAETLYERFGWKADDAFLWGNRLYHNGDVIVQRVSPALEARAELLRPQPRGSLECWSNAASQLFGQGMEAQAFGLVSSFAGPLLKLMSTEEGGTILSLVNRNTGTGKTTLLRAIASVWGQYKGLKIFDDDTRVAKSLKLGFLGNLPAVYDELATRDPEIIRQFVLAFTNGQDRDRGLQSGTGLVATASEWQTLLCVASNKPLTEILTSQGQAPAMAFRLLELTVNLTDKADKDHGDELVNTMDQNAGWAADRYLRYITVPTVLMEIRRLLPHYSDQVRRKAQLGAEHRFWCRLIAASAVAAVITKHLGILDFSPQHLLNWICDQMVQRKSDLRCETEFTQVEKLVEFVNAHYHNTLIVQHEYKPRITQVGAVQTPRDKLMIRRELNTQTCYIVQSLLHEFLAKQDIHRGNFLAELRKLGVLKEQDKLVTLGANTVLAAGQQRCYVFDLAHPNVTGFPRLTVVEGGKDTSAQS